MRLEGWLNLDVQDLPGVDQVVDVSRGLHFRDVEAVYAEHFLEHLDLDAALAFLEDVHRCLRPAASCGCRRPTSTGCGRRTTRRRRPEVRRVQGLRLNRAFHGWRHRFLWNRDLLGDALVACGFRDLRWCRYGESAREVFRGIEHHDTYEDRPDLPHVLIVERRRDSRAGGARGAADPLRGRVPELPQRLSAGGHAPLA